MGEPVKDSPASAPDFCHAYPLACAGVSAVRLARRRRAGGLPRHRLGNPAETIPPCTPGYCYLFEEISLERDGRQR